MIIIYSQQLCQIVVEIQEKQCYSDKMSKISTIISQREAERIYTTNRKALMIKNWLHLA
ncbi:unnamed protein product, partial (macronuclear) [Paramecium tetraurelia]